MGLLAVGVEQSDNDAICRKSAYREDFIGQVSSTSRSARISCRCLLGLLIKGVILELYWDNGKENGNYYIM